MTDYIRGDGASVVVDDSAIEVFGGAQWRRDTGISGALNGTISVCQPVLNGPEGEAYLQVTLLGSYFEVVGRVPPDLELEYSIDWSPRFRVELNRSPSFLNKHGVVILRSNAIPESQRSESLSRRLRLYPTRGQFQLDYVAYTPETVVHPPLTLLADDSYTAVWNTTRSIDPSVEYDQNPPPVVPWGHTWAESTSTGKIMAFNFREGSSYAIYGATHHVPGTLRAAYWLDGALIEEVTHINISRDEDVNRARWDVGVLHRGVVTPFEDASRYHTLEVHVLEATEEQRYHYDYMTWEPTRAVQWSGGVAVDGSDTSSGPSRVEIGSGVAGVIAFFLIACMLWRIFRMKSMAARRQAFGLRPRPFRYGLSETPGGIPLPPGSAPVARRQDDENDPPPPWSPPESSLNGPPPAMPQPWQSTNSSLSPVATPYAPPPGPPPPLSDFGVAPSEAAPPSTVPPYVTYPPPPGPPPGRPPLAAGLQSTDLEPTISQLSQPRPSSPTAPNPPPSAGAGDMQAPASPSAEESPNRSRSPPFEANPVEDSSDGGRVAVEAPPNTRGAAGEGATAGLGQPPPYDHGRP